MHALHLSDIEYVVSFVRNYADDSAILLPGRISGYKRDDVVLLPSSTTKTAVWNLYCTAAKNVLDVKSVGYSFLLHPLEVTPPPYPSLQANMPAEQ